MLNVRKSQTLIFDADDTLWECNKYFEESIHAFIEFLHHEHMNHDEVRQIVDSFERKNGYGAQAFAQSLVETYRELATEIDPGDEEMVRSFGLRILDQQMEAIDDVEQTLRALLPHHRLLMCTKGDEEEQRLKISRSELADYFELHIVVDEKTTRTYADIVESLQLDSKSTWMIGNSPRSDIYPALEAGINAILIPNPHTWHMEIMELTAAPNWVGEHIEIEGIHQLLNIFYSVSAG